MVSQLASWQDYNMRSTLSKVVCSTLSDLTWHQVPLPFRVGDLALSASWETSEWLKAFPTPSLGLAMPCSEFITLLRIWLDIPILWRPVIDIYGHYVLSCGLGSVELESMMHSVTLYAMPILQDKQSRVSGDAQDQLGDKFHPDDFDGHLTLF